MSPGASYASVAAAATWTAITGAPDANYGIANLADLVNVSRVARIAPASGAIAMSFDLPATTQVQCIALARHNLAAAETVRLRIYSGAALGGVLIYDSGVVAMWPTGAPVSPYSPGRPFVLAVPVGARSGRLDFAGLAGTLEIGAIEIAAWMGWTISPGVSFGFSTRAADVPVVGGGAEAGDVFLPRTVSGQIDYLALTTTETQGLDFQRQTGKAVPFIFVQDADDPTSWARWCFLARNTDLPTMVGAMYRHDRFQIRLVEHFR